MAAKPLPAAAPDQLQAVNLSDLFLAHSQNHHAPDSFAVYKFLLKSIYERHGRLPAAGVIPFYVTSWVDSKPTCKGSRRNAALTVKRAFSWAGRQGLFTPSTLIALADDLHDKPTA